MSETVTVFVRLMGDPNELASTDIRVFRGDIPGGVNFSYPGWVRFNEVPVQETPGLGTATGDTTT